MNYQSHTFPQYRVQASLSRFDTAQEGTAEQHAMLRLLPESEPHHATGTPAAHPAERLFGALRALLAMPENTTFRPALIRLFLSDAANQAESLTAYLAQYPKAAVSIVQQPPLDGTKMALWVYLIPCTMEQERRGDTLAVRHNGYLHLWQASRQEEGETSARQTRNLLLRYEKDLRKYGANTRDHCIRTWFFVRDVDSNYAGVVEARREEFLRMGLTPQTHYIASTGIQGQTACPRTKVMLDTYAIAQGLRPGQVQQLYAGHLMNRTIDYGVTFERGTAVCYGDRKHVFISGTASIDHRGEVVHTGCIQRQTERMWTNVEALLEEGGCGWEDVAQIIVYLRDTADYAEVSALFARRFPHHPVCIVLAPVCRPAWLIEMECIAIAPNEQPEFADF